MRVSISNLYFSSFQRFFAFDSQDKVYLLEINEGDISERRFHLHADPNSWQQHVPFWKRIIKHESMQNEKRFIKKKISFLEDIFNSKANCWEDKESPMWVKFTIKTGSVLKVRNFLQLLSTQFLAQGIRLFHCFCAGLFLENCVYINFFRSGSNSSFMIVHV